MKVLMLDGSPLWAKSLLSTMRIFKNCNAELVYSQQKPREVELQNWDVIFWDSASISKIYTQGLMKLSWDRQGKYPYLVAIMDHLHEHQIRSAMELNPAAVISRGLREFEVQQLMRCIHAKKKFIQQDILPHIRRFQRTLALEGEVLTKREKRVLFLVCCNFSNVEIAQKLSLSPETIKKHRKNINAKIEAQNPLEYLAFAFRTGLLCPISWAQNKQEPISAVPYLSML